MSFEFFADRNFGCRQFPDALRRAGITIHRHRDHFAVDAADEVWLPEVARRGWVSLTLDKAILRNELERDAVFVSGARLILLSGANAPVPNLARNFINTYERVNAFLQREPAPFIARVKRPNPLSDVELGKPETIEMPLSLQAWRDRR
ncbi:MAG TPA: hypothetical protein VF710_10270 [Longimicrobium sp.]